MKKFQTVLLALVCAYLKALLVFGRVVVYRNGKSNLPLMNVQYIALELSNTEELQALYDPSNLPVKTRIDLAIYVERQST